MNIWRLQPFVTAAPSDQLVRFTHGNSKLPNSTMILSLPAGHTCPGAKDCLTRVPRDGGSAWTTPGLDFACYAAAQERYRTSVRDLRWRNFDLLAPLSSLDIIANLATAFLNQRRSFTERVRFFESGDAFKPELAEAITTFAWAIEPMVVYLYTKALPFWITQDIPANLRITASRGGRFDHLIAEHFTRSARVVQTEAEARSLGLPLDFDDSYAYQDEPVHFAHLVHGWQPKGSTALAAINQRRAAGEFTGYGASSSNPHRSLTPSC
jgi:hypothetical protein